MRWEFYLSLVIIFKLFNCFFLIFQALDAGQGGGGGDFLFNGYLENKIVWGGYEIKNFFLVIILAARDFRIINPRNIKAINKGKHTYNHILEKNNMSYNR